ncbi:MAG: transglutaminase-like cysteine peptidase [Rhodobiaceae bacterium]|nr:transglutaminase-like cysteine peptidase [Rhodobiaceae bacterium]
MGKNTLIALCVAASALGACAQNDIRPTAALAPNMAPESTRMAEATVTMPPSGYLDYCVRNPAECPSGERGATQPELLTPARWAELDRVNTIVNASVRYVTDASLYNRNEYWTYPNGRGDCEDYVLAKRKMLLDRGWRAETLLIGVALDLEGLRHAVLIASTDKGDFVLDNQLEQVVAWQETGYTWEKRQTASNPNIWVALTGQAAAPIPLEAPVVLPFNVATAQDDIAQDSNSVASAGSVETVAVSEEQAPITPLSTRLSAPLPQARPLPSTLLSQSGPANNSMEIETMVIVSAI